MLTLAPESLLTITGIRRQWVETTAVPKDTSSMLSIFPECDQVNPAQEVSRIGQQWFCVLVVLVECKGCDLIGAVVSRVYLG